MADSIITKQKLIDANKNADSWEKYWNGNENENVQTHLNKLYPTHAKALKILMENGGLQPFETQTKLLASTPIVDPTAAKALDTKKVWLWKAGGWIDTGLSELDQAIEYADEQKVQKYQALNRPDILYEVTDAQGNQTWIQASNKDGMPTDFAKMAIRNSASIVETKQIIVAGESILYAVCDENGNPSALAIRKSDGMLAQFVIDNIASRLNILPPDVNLNELQYKPKATDFQVLSSISRGLARHVSNKPLPAKITNFVNSTNQNTRLTFPNSYSDATPIILVICFEGVGDFALDIRAAYSGVLDKGVLWARCQFHENSYGSPKAMQDAVEIYQKACEIAPIGGVVVVGNSMGGVAALNALTTEAIPNILGVYLTDPVCDLRQRYDNGRASEINAAYECDATTYATKTAGFDPILQHWSKFKGVPISIVATSNDTLVSMSAHTDKLAEKLKFHNKISVIDTKAGWHNHPDEFIVSNLISFINQCTSGAIITNA